MPGQDLELGYVGDQESIPAYNSTAPWQSGGLHLPVLMLMVHCVKAGVTCLVMTWTTYRV